ncbi:HAMP domain-containing sensor histidine kinase [Actinoallomurus bryophytorum]|uniref:histidine kinase n=1 Tax=Actinoallomurus bryophytorum TaxID=1490222 RepID=A0A543CU58_9ACTN|nr:HAMP domain-containing sensor histidine kinase [Actinoallomurus bryophytorum]TQM00617.1 two-component system OmpR family sensor kinase [Actinoallomurus bryophytorum]
MSFRIRTLRGRLIAGLLVLLTVACAVVGLVTTLALHAFLVARLDQQLTAAGTRYAVNLEHPDGAGDADREHGQAVGTFGARLIDGRITQCGVVSDRGGQLVLETADRQRLAGLAAGSGPETIDLEALGEYRVIAAAGQDGDVLITGLPMHGLEQTLDRVEVTELIVFGAVLLGTAIAGTVFVRLTLRPLRRIAATATEVSRRPLGSGEIAMPGPVPYRDPGTEVGQVGIAFNRMLEHVGSALAQRHASEDRLRRFVADASHELRTPLAAIRSHAELAGRDADGSGPEVRHALSRVEAESARMGHLVDDLLLLARLDAGRPLAHDQVDLTRLAIDTTSDARAAGPDHRWSLDLPGEPVVLQGDEYRLHQVLGNLLTNARTHTPGGTNVTVRVAADEPGTVTLEVTDDGPGVPADLQEKAFERFVRGDDSRSRRAGSTGLGLAIVSAVVQAHGGTVTLTSAPGRTEIRIRLPERASPAQAGGTAQP